MAATRGGREGERERPRAPAPAARSAVASGRRRKVRARPRSSSRRQRGGETERRPEPPKVPPQPCTAGYISSFMGKVWKQQMYPQYTTYYYPQYLQAKVWHGQTGSGARTRLGRGGRLDSTGVGDRKEPAAPSCRLLAAGPPDSPRPPGAPFPRTPSAKRSSAGPAVVSLCAGNDPEFGRRPRAAAVRRVLGRGRDELPCGGRRGTAAARRWWPSFRLDGDTAAWPSGSALSEELDLCEQPPRSFQTGSKRCLGAGCGGLFCPRVALVRRKTEFSSSNGGESPAFCLLYYFFPSPL